MNIEEAKCWIGSMVKWKDAAGHSSGKLVECTGKVCIVARGDGQRFSISPELVSPWKAGNSRIGFQSAVPTPTPPARPVVEKEPEIKKAEPILGSPAPITAKTSTAELAARFDAAKADLEVWEGIVAAAKADLNDADEGRDAAFKTLDGLGKLLLERIKYPA